MCDYRLWASADNRERGAKSRSWPRYVSSSEETRRSGPSSSVPPAERHSPWRQEASGRSDFPLFVVGEVEDAGVGDENEDFLALWQFAEALVVDPELEWSVAVDDKLALPARDPMKALIEPQLRAVEAAKWVCCVRCDEVNPLSIEVELGVG